MNESNVRIKTLLVCNEWFHWKMQRWANTAAHWDSFPLSNALKFEAFHELKVSVRTEPYTHWTFFLEIVNEWTWMNETFTSKCFVWIHICKDFQGYLLRQTCLLQSENYFKPAENELLVQWMFNKG